VCYTIERGGGAEKVLVTLANEWIARGWDVHVITIAASRRDEHVLDPRAHRLALGVASVSSNVFSAQRSNAKRLWGLRQAVLGVQPDVVISFIDTVNITTVMALLGTGLPVVIAERCDPRQVPLAASWRLLRRATYPFASMLVIQTEELRSWAGRLVDRQRVRVIPNPLPPQPEVPSAPVEAGRRRALAIGRLTHQKGFDLLLNAFATIASIHRNWDLVILGEGPDRHLLEAQSERMGLADRVRFLGKVESPQPWLRSADMFVLPSRFEGFPNALIEAMGAGIASVSFRCPTGPAVIIRDGVDGVLVEPQNVDALARAMSVLMADDEKRRELGLRASSVLERFSVNRVISAWEEAARAAVVSARRRQHSASDLR
jgi:glycosyltransferase involved in cell wall biosynthesis